MPLKIGTDHHFAVFEHQFYSGNMKMPILKLRRGHFSLLSNTEIYYLQPSSWELKDNAGLKGCIMNKTTAIALKIFAIYLIFSVLVSIPSIIAATWGLVNMGQPSPPVILYAAIILIPTIFFSGIALWILWKTANSIAPKSEAAQQNTETIDLEKLFQYAISLMGLYFALNAMIAAPRLTFSIHRQTIPIHLNAYFPALITTIAQFILGCVLIAKPKQWMSWLKRIGNK